MLHRPDLHINSLGKDLLALNLLVSKDAHGMLGDVTDTSSLVIVTFIRHSFSNSAYSLDAYYRKSNFL